MFSPLQCSCSLPPSLPPFANLTGDAEQHLRDWDDNEKPRLDRNKEEIARYQSDDRATFNSAEAKLRAAQGRLASAQSHVNSLNSEINNYRNEKRHCHGIDIHCRAHNGWLDAKIAAVWTAMKGAEGALDIAKGAVDVAEKAVGAAGAVTTHADPRVVALETEDGTIEAAYKVAEAGLHAAQAISDGAEELVQFPLELLANAFNVEKVWFEAESLGAVKSHGQVSAGVQGKLLDRSVDWHLTIPFPPKVDDILTHLWDVIKSDLKL